MDTIVGQIDLASQEQEPTQQLDPLPSETTQSKSKKNKSVIEDNDFQPNTQPILEMKFYDEGNETLYLVINGDGTQTNLKILNDDEAAFSLISDFLSKHIKPLYNTFPHNKKTKEVTSSPSEDNRQTLELPEEDNIL